jgi:hypothetical protein
VLSAQLRTDSLSVTSLYFGAMIGIQSLLLFNCGNGRHRQDKLPFDRNRSLSVFSDKYYVDFVFSIANLLKSMVF